MKRYIPAIVALLLMASCTPVPPCELQEEYTVRVVSDVYDAYALYIDGEYVEDIPGIGYVELAVPVGYHEVYLEQLEGFRTQPNTEIYDVRGETCDYVEILFPD